MMAETRIVEINGVKVEVDLRQAREVRSYRVGDKVKLLRKTYDGYKTHPGVIVGFDNFEKLPTIVIAYFESSWTADPKIEFAYLNAQSKDVEACPMIGDEEAPTLEEFNAYFGRAVEKKRAEIRELEEKRDYFVRRFGMVAPLRAPEPA